MAIAGAIYDAMRDRQIRYINPPASFEGTGQKIRPQHEVLVDRWSTCLDLATTYHRGPAVDCCGGSANRCPGCGGIVASGSALSTASDRRRASEPT